jgi:MerR family transcriptional regulator/heat shock protein HspR
MALRERTDRGVYGITTAAELAGVAVPTLRLYERRGLLTPSRTNGGTRRYSQDDLTRLGRIGTLVADGVNLTGIAQILTLQTTNTTLASTNKDLTVENTRLRAEREHAMTTHADDVPEADHLDQLTPTAPDPDDATTGESVKTLTDRWDADATDLLEQATPVDVDDDAYPHHTEADDTDLPG